MEFNSQEISIRPYEIIDVDDFMIYAGDEKVTRFTRWDTFTSKDSATAYIKDTCIPHPFCRSICLNNRSIGFLFIKPASGYDMCRAEVGYALAAEYWGRGIVVKAMKIAVSEAVKVFPELLRFQALVEAENKASQRVLEKIGFFREGLLRKYTFNKGEVRDMVIFSLLATDPML
ncbi:uncharacterized protein LOC131324281 [Rhododendron vialii]|uniref:uncharacterized protein LOC131324281 n=1 Tax=Rhododendron vialii TaxID=182163 RepID=UPI00265D61AB|nr:uncharacterized protein LOC131324281 [Rhododendron vialii]